MSRENKCALGWVSGCVACSHNNGVCAPTAELWWQQAVAMVGAGLAEQLETCEPRQECKALAGQCEWGQDFLPAARRCGPVLLTVGVCGKQGKGSTQSSVFHIPAMCTLFLWCGNHQPSQESWAERGRGRGSLQCTGKEASRTR